MMKRYAIEIYPPNNLGLDVTCRMESEEPFLPIQRGDLINPRTWSKHYYDQLQSYHPSQYGIVLRVIGIEHVIVQEPDGDGFIHHTLRIYTQAADDLEESRP